MAVEFVLTTGSVASSESAALVTATEHMARQMQGELWGYLAIPTTRSTGGSVATSQILELRDDPATLQQAWNAAVGRFAGAGPTPAWLAARQRMWNYFRGAGVALGTTQTVDIETTYSGDPLIGFLYHTGGGSISANPFTWWVPVNGGMDVMGGSPEGRAAMSPTMQLLHELDHKYNCINPGQGTCRANIAGVFGSGEENAVHDIDLSMLGHRDVAQRGWYGDVHAMQGSHELQNRPDRYYFMGGANSAVAYGDSLATGAANPQSWPGAWVRYAERGTLLHGTAPTRPVASTAPIPRNTAPPAQPSAPVEPIDPRNVLPGMGGPRHRRRRGVARTRLTPAAAIQLQRLVGNRAVATIQRDSAPMSVRDRPFPLALPAPAGHIGLHPSSRADAALESARPVRSRA